MLASLCIFLASGKTFTFRDVEIAQDNETVLVFRYKAMSDGLHKTAVFYKSNMAGNSSTGAPLVTTKRRRV